MPQQWKPNPREVYKSWVDAIISEASDSLSSWETEFIDSIDNRLKHSDLTEKQADVLERIYTEKTK